MRLLLLVAVIKICILLLLTLLMSFEQHCLTRCCRMQLLEWNRRTQRYTAPTVSVDIKERQILRILNKATSAAEVASSHE